MPTLSSCAEGDSSGSKSRTLIGHTRQAAITVKYMLYLGRWKTEDESAEEGRRCPSVRKTPWHYLYGQYRALLLRP